MSTVGRSPQQRSLCFSQSLTFSPSISVSPSVSVFLPHLCLPPSISVSPQSLLPFSISLLFPSPLLESLCVPLLATASPADSGAEAAGRGRGEGGQLAGGLSRKEWYVPVSTTQWGAWDMQPASQSPFAPVGRAGALGPAMGAHPV